jgi:hypothetical protein
MVAGILHPEEKRGQSLSTVTECVAQEMHGS